MNAILSVRRQRGAIGLMAVATLLIACLFLMLAVDGGRLYLEKRKLQRVADMAALEAVIRGGSCQGGVTTAEGFARENARMRNGFDPSMSSRTFRVVCGHKGVSGTRNSFITDSSGHAVEVRVTERVPASLVLGGMFGEQVLLSAQAVADRQAPVGRLALRTTLLSVDTQRSLLLNAVFGGLLGGTVNLDAASWQGLAKSDINLLSYLDLLATDLGLSVGDYQQVLKSDVALGKLLELAAASMSRASNTADAATAVAGLTALKLAVPAGTPLLRLSDVLKVQSGVPEAGLDVALNAFQLAEALVQLANSRNALVAEVPLNLPGLGSATVNLQVIEPPQLSAIGDLDRAKASPSDPANRIYVRTAQVRTLVSLNLGGGLTSLSNTVNGSLDSLMPVTSFLNEALNLNLVDAIGNLLGGLICPLLGPCPSANTAAVQALAGNGRIDLSLDAGGAEAYVIDYQCNNPNQPSLTVRGKGALANLRVGQLGTSPQSAKESVFSSHLAPVVKPLPVLSLGEQTVRPDSCLLTLCSGLKWKRGSSNWVVDKANADIRVLAGFGVMVDAPVAGSSQQVPDTLILNVPPLDQLPRYQTLGNDAGRSLVQSLNRTLSGITVQAYKMEVNNLLGALLSASLGLVNILIGQLQEVISGVLSPLLDPLINLLLDTLGVDLAKAEVGANMSCGFGARLVL